MDFSIVIPWADTSPERERIFEVVLKRWESLFPSIEIVLGDSEPFSRSAARNNGAELASHDILLFADADTICNKDNILQAQKMLEAGSPWVICYGNKDYYNGTKEQAQDLSWIQDSQLNEPKIYEHKLLSWAGLIMMKKVDFLKVKYDERFTHWGWEDLAFMIKANATIGNFDRTDGFVYHIWHPRTDATFDTSGELESRNLFNREYRARYNWRDPR